MNRIPLAAVLVALAPLAALAESTEEKLAAKFPGIEAKNIRPAPVEGLWEVVVDGRVVYLSGDGRYLVRGDLTDLATGKSLTEARQADMRLGLLGELDESRMIVFAPKQPTHTITVFTDIDCGYCRRLHREMKAINDHGIKVRYLFYPRTGPGTESWTKAESVWCSPDRNDALTRAKAGEEITAKTCKSTPVAEQYELGNKFGVRGTPAIITESGELLPGYVPADQLAKMLESKGS
jgi:thiol:disulfide interchange protein DsbC